MAHNLQTGEYEKKRHQVLRNVRSDNASGLRLGAILIGVIAALYLAQATFIPLAFAITLALILSPAVSWLQKLHIRRIPAALVMMLITVTATLGISYVIFNQLMHVTDGLPTYRETIRGKIAALSKPSEGALGRAAQNMQELRKDLSTPPDGAVNTPARPLPVRVIETPPSALASLRDLVHPFLSPLATLGIVLVFTVFLLVEESDLRNRLFRLAGLHRLNVTTKALEDATKRVSRYLMLQFLVNAGFGVLFGIGLYLIGVPYAALWGTVAALLRIIPYVGSAAAGLLPLLLSLAVFDAWMKPAMVFALFAGLELVIANFMEPWLYGSHLGISSLALLLTTVFWATLWGPAGLILSTPLTVCLVVLGRHVPHLSFLHILLGDEPVLEPQVQLYQQLLAMDDQEARKVVEVYWGEHSMTELYDQVIMPALTIAERDRHNGALDSERQEFCFMSFRDILSECSEKAHQPTTDSQPQETPSAIKAGRILCFPSHDEADEIAALMLAQLLDQAGWETVAFPLDSSLQSMLDMVQPVSTDVFCISSIPPFSLAHARTLAWEIRVRFPQGRIFIGMWGFSGDSKRALKRFEPVHPDKLVTSLKAALEYLVPPVPA